MGSSKGGKGQSKQLTAQADTVFRESTPIRRQLLGQQGELLRTGGTPQAQVPVIQRAVEAQRQAQSGSLRQVMDQLGGAGMGGDPFSQGILANARAVGDSASAGVASQIGQNMMQSAPNFALGFPQVAGSNLAGAGTIANAKGGGKTGLLG